EVGAAKWVVNSLMRRSAGLVRGQLRARIGLRRGGVSDQADHTDKVVRSCHEVAGQLSPCQTVVARASEPANRLHPAKDLFNPLPNSLTDGITRITRCTALDRTAPPTAVLSHVPPHVLHAGISDTSPGSHAPVRTPCR